MEEVYSRVPSGSGDALCHDVSVHERPRLIPLEHGVLDLQRGAIERDGERIPLTTKEVELLRYLAARSSQDVAREDLLTDVWGYAATAMTRAVDTAVKRLRKKLEVDPAEPRHLLSVHGVGYRFEPGEPVDAPVAEPVASPPVATELPSRHIPIDADRFVGRAEEATAVDDAFASGRRLVTLRGAAGVGKSRLAREIAHRTKGAVGLIALGGVSPDALRATLAAGLGAGREDDAALVEAIRARGAILLVLDDADGVLDEVAAQVRQVLSTCRDLRVLITARAALEIPEETVVTVEPLRRGDAIVLFLDRAAPGLEPTDPEIAALVDDLDRLPLALELAAPRTRVLAPADLRARLQQRFKVLARRRGGGLEEAIAFSWELLDPDERAVLEACSVFRGGFSVEAAEVVAEPEDPDAPWVIDLLEALEAKSMIHRQVLPGAGARLALLESVRTFVAARAAESGRDHIAAARHRQVYVRLGEELLEALHGPEVASAAAAMAVERRNLVAAWSSAPEGEERARLAVVIGTQGMHASTVEEVRGILEGTAVHGLPPALEADLRIARATLYRSENRFDMARTEALEASARGQEGGNTEAVLDAVRLLAGLDADEGDLGAAVARLEAIRTDAGAHPTVARLRLLAREALLRFHHGEVDAAEVLIDELLAGAVARRSPWHEHEAYRLRAGIHLRRSRIAEAQHEGEQALAGFSAIGDRWREALCRELLGAIASFAGRHADAERSHGAAVRLYRQMGRRHELPRALGNLARACVHQGRIGDARKAADQALAAAREHGEWRAIEESAMLGGTIAIAEERWSDAEECFTQGVEQAESVGEVGVAAIALAARAYIRMLQGRPDAAAPDNARARSAFADAKDRLNLAFHTGVAAVIEAERGDPDGAARLLAEADAARPAGGSHRELGLWLAICRALVQERTPAAADRIRARLEADSASTYVRALAGHLFRTCSEPPAVGASDMD